MAKFKRNQISFPLSTGKCIGTSGNLPVGFILNDADYHQFCLVSNLLCKWFVTEYFSIAF